MTTLQDYGWIGDLPPKGTLARVVKEFQHIYHIVTESGRSEAIVTGQFRHQINTNADYPVVGDWVLVSDLKPDNRYHIESVITRRNALSRVHKHYNREEQVLVSNVDIAFIMVSGDGYRQDNENRLNRFIQLITHAGVSPVILCNKMDLITNVTDTIYHLKATVSPYEVIPIQAKFNTGIDDVYQHLLPQKMAIVLGVSGVGKSTLINQLLNKEIQMVQDVRVKDKKGMHTTRNRELFLLPNGGLIIDTPGIKSLEVWQDDTTSIMGPGDARFDRIRELATQCKFSNCTHQHEPRCAVKAAVESGELDHRIVRLFFLSKNR
jgi:ribosome biogenesis GTPase